MTSSDDERRFGAEPNPGFEDDTDPDGDVGDDVGAEGGSEGDSEFTGYRDDRDLWEGPQDGPKAIKLIQGYVWHPRDQELELDKRLAAELSGGVHVLVDAMPQAPFTFFEDGTMSATQQVYQLTVVAIVQPGNDPAKLLPEVAQQLQAKLDETPKDVGWQLMEDLREVD